MSPSLAFMYVSFSHRSLHINPHSWQDFYTHTCIHACIDPTFSLSMPRRTIPQHSWGLPPPMMIICLVINIVNHCANLFQLCTATERSQKVASLCSPAQVHITMPTWSTPEAPEILILPYYRRSAVFPKVSSLEGLHCIYIENVFVANGIISTCLDL